eukprot:6195678-Pleurochrysis_carterae.AAC.1
MPGALMQTLHSGWRGDVQQITRCSHVQNGFKHESRQAALKRANPPRYDRPARASACCRRVGRPCAS